MKKSMVFLAFVFPLSASAQTIDFAVEAVDFFADKKICITNANELDEDLLRSLNLID